VVLETALFLVVPLLTGVVALLAGTYSAILKKRHETRLEIRVGKDFPISITLPENLSEEEVKRIIEVIVRDLEQERIRTTPVPSAESTK